MKALIAVLLFSSVCFADTYKYIAYADKFKSRTDNVVFDDSERTEGTRTLKEFGKTRQNQPSDDIQFIVVKNTDVAFVEISFADDTEKTLYERMAGDGRLFLYEISGVVEEDRIITVRKSFSLPIPVDINKDWSVNRSSR